MCASLSLSLYAYTFISLSSSHKSCRSFFPPSQTRTMFWRWLRAQDTEGESDPRTPLPLPRPFPFPVPDTLLPVVRTFERQEDGTSRCLSAVERLPSLRQEHLRHLSRGRLQALPVPRGAQIALVAIPPSPAALAPPLHILHHRHTASASASASSPSFLLPAPPSSVPLHLLECLLVQCVCCSPPQHTRWVLRAFRISEDDAGPSSSSAISDALVVANAAGATGERKARYLPAPWLRAPREQRELFRMPGDPKWAGDILLHMGTEHTHVLAGMLFHDGADRYLWAVREPPAALLAARALDQQQQAAAVAVTATRIRVLLPRAATLLGEDRAVTTVRTREGRAFLLPSAVQTGEVRSTADAPAARAPGWLPRELVWQPGGHVWRVAQECAESAVQTLSEVSAALECVGFRGPASLASWLDIYDALSCEA